MIERWLIVALVGVSGILALITTAHASYTLGLHDDEQLILQSIVGMVVGLCLIFPLLLRTRR